MGPVLAIVAMLPGFALPFVLSAAVGQKASDPFFLAVSVALVLSNVVGNTIELNSVVQFGRALSLSGSISRSELRSFRRKIRIFALLAVLAVGPVLIGVYFVTLPSHSRVEFLTVAAITLAVPLIGGEASSRSGHLIACRKQELAIFMQSMRSVVPLLLVLVWPAAPLAFVAASMVLGELIRLLVLSLLSRNLNVAPRGALAPLATKGLVTQSLSTSTVQLSPVADRMFLSNAPIGSLTAYELADKVFFAGVQFLNLGFLVNRVRMWSHLRSMNTFEGKRHLRRDFKILLGFSAAASALAIALLQGAPLLFDVPSEWRLGLFWAQLALVSLPMSVVGMACSRLLVIADRQDLLIWVAVGITVGTVIFDFIGFIFLGAIGIPIAAICVRTLGAAIQVILAWKALVPILGADIATAPRDGELLPSHS